MASAVGLPVPQRSGVKSLSGMQNPALFAGRTSFWLDARRSS